MKKILINYAHNLYFNSQKICSQTALDIGGFDEVIEYGQNDIAPNYIEKNKHIFNQRRGGGY